MKPNFSSRRRVYDAKELAANITKTFKDREVEFEETYAFSWPETFKNVGESLAVCYESDKWKTKDGSGKRATEVYKHIAESRNWAYVAPGVIYDYRKRDRLWPTVGPTVTFSDAEFPAQFSILGKCECVQLRMYEGADANPKLGNVDKSVVEVTIPGAMLGASEMVRRGRRTPFLLVYHRQGGVLMVILGERLGVEKDGIVG